MAISKQQVAVIAKIVSYNPATWFLACESEALKIPEKDRVEFGKILLEAMDVYKSKVQNVIPILKRGPNLNPEVNIRAWAMMHARFLARLFIKHPTLCERLCVKLSNETYNPGWRCHVKKFKDIEEHKNEIEEQVEAACRESQLFFSTHSGYNFVITNHIATTHNSQLKMQNYPRFEAQSRQLAAQSLLALSQSDEAQHNHDSISSSHVPPPQITPLQVNGRHDQAMTSNSKSHNGERQSKHVRFALALEKSAAAELEAISRMNGNSFLRTPQEKAYQLNLERELQAQIASQNDDLYGVSDDERGRPTSATKLNNGERTATSSSVRRTDATKSAVNPDSDIEEEIQLTPSINDSEVRASENRQGLGSRRSLSLSNIQESTLNKTATPNRSLEIEDHLENENSSPAESVDGDSNEHFSLREMIDAMEFVAEHPWICEHLLVDHVWDEYKLFHEYNTEALKVAEEEIEESNRAIAKEATPSTHKGTEGGPSHISVHRTRSASQTSRSPSAPPSHPTSSSHSAPSVRQANTIDGTIANNMTAAEEEQAITAAAKVGFVNRNFQLQVATVYRALGVVPTAAGLVPSINPPLNRVPSSESFNPTNNAPPRRERSSDRSASGNSQPKRRSRSSMGRYKATNPVVDNDTIIVDTSSRVPAYVHFVPNHIAPPRRGRSSDELVPVYAAPKRRSQSNIGEANVIHGTDVNPSTNSDRAKKGLTPTMNRAQMREQLQIAAVYQSLGRQNEMSSENFGNDGARIEMEEEVQEFPSAIHTLTPEKTRRGRDAGPYEIPRDYRIPSFELQANVPEIFAQDRSLSMHGGIGAPRDFGFNSYVNQNMDFLPGLTAHRRAATSTGQDQEGFSANQIRTEQEIGLAGLSFSGPGNGSLNQQVPGISGLSQPLAALDNPQEDFWINRGNFGDFGPVGMDLNIDLNMDLGAELPPAPNFNDIHGLGNHFADLRGNYNFDFSVENVPFTGLIRSSRHLGAFNPDAIPSSFGGTKQSFGSVNQNVGAMNQAPVGLEGMDEFMFHNTPLAQINAGFGVGNMNQSFDQPDGMGPVDVSEIPRRERSGTRSQPGEALVPVTPNRTRASTRSQRRYDLSARGGNYFRFQDTESVDGEDGEDEEGNEEDDAEEMEEDEDDEDDFEEESPSKRARHPKNSSRGSTRNPTRSPGKASAKDSAKGTPRKSRKTPVKKGPKVAFNPRPASAPSTLDRGPPRRYHQTTINISPGARGPQLNLETSGRQRRLPFTTVAQDRAEFKKEFEMDPEDPDL
ncbi:uncharacterized protein Bfra_011527 [Botrytis fragariae]|uniref:Uncharacterized protein n=1 Tax=Botrytis fragariae TaxID=1964551 RepID=A0A8H6AYF3_9HELO|nr:uncharacterized protein Bfra_011527 [Botrytis fragariae]KAF5875765.1 hypothetical protein Bfra_011527 [Botrytis fragariae]